MIIYIDNLSTETTETDLQSVFEVFGHVQTAKIMSDRTSGKSKCFGLEGWEAAHRDTNGPERIYHG